ncbi:MAG TPA: flagellar biosynthetic protein FliR [Halanaerobiales bacterium]|jgi:flagellar biosynthetic protein FliR|nr:flagellar biosynthetic protein FliR [Bacillota bacterium]HOA40599.1 flagellar biosynthetic protein FliR [Halanaerobiales bacterium]HPZ63074.1 flagellar biosynthetic protein FliR [Halanaerobiales bacterium]HQD03999.1 flagellar biosynthetic protein FliR [Halanaerobiales bacterium]
MDLQNLFSNYTYIFILIMVRYIGLFMVAPIFGSRVIPARVRLALILFLSIITLPLLTNMQGVELPLDLLHIIIAVLGEFAVGLSIGFISYLVFAAIQFAGHYLDFSMGFAMVNVIDPISQAQAPVLGQFKNILAILVFLAVNGHHLLLKALYYSYQLIPIGKVSLSPAFFSYIFSIVSEFYRVAIIISLPVVGTLFVANVVLGFLARTVPQMNIFIIGLPIKILVGFAVLILSLAFSIYYFQELFRDMYRHLSEFTRIIGQG